MDLILETKRTQLLKFSYISDTKIWHKWVIKDVFALHFIKEETKITYSKPQKKILLKI